jgi:CelD/BcsL family acetyltransferase involved in cellulose biosynthesis
MSEISINPRTPLDDVIRVASDADKAVTSGRSAVLPRISVTDDLAAVADAWRALEATSDSTAFQAYAWAATWQIHIGARSGTVPAIVTGHAEDGRPLFLFAFGITPARGLKRLTWLASDVCDYNAPMLARDYAATLDNTRFLALWRGILDALAGDPRFAFDYADLERMPEKLGRLRDPFMALNPALHPSGAHACALTGDWETFYAAKRSASTRKTIRKKVRAIEKQGPVAFRDLTESTERRQTLDVLMVQKAESLARMGVSNFFDRPGYRDFYRAVASDPAMGDLVRIARLDVGSDIAATSVGLSAGGCFYLILASYDAGPLSSHGPGTVHLHELLRDTIEKGFSRFDFTVGDEPYKLDWGDEIIRLFDYSAGRTLRGWVLVLTARGFRRVKRTIKQTPALWHLFVRLRSLVGDRRATGHRDDCG